MNAVLCVDYKNKDNIQERWYIDVKGGFVYSDARTINVPFPVKRLNNKILYWNQEERKWIFLRSEFNTVYDEYLKLLKIVENSEMNEEIDKILLSDEDLEGSA